MITNRSILKGVFLFITLLAFGAGNAQNCCSKNTTANCPKKGQPDCPLIQNCTKKGQSGCPLVNKDSCIASTELANCPLAGTPECPLIKNCPKKNAADCPYSTNKKTVVSNAKDEDIPPCCRKKPGTN